MGRNLVGDRPEERSARDTDAGRDPCRYLRDLAAYPLGQADRVTPVTGHRHHELLTTDAADDAVAATGVTQDVADGDQGPVAGGVAVGVVDPLEVIEIHHHHRQVGVAVPTRLGG